MMPISTVLLLLFVVVPATAYVAIHFYKKRNSNSPEIGKLKTQVTNLTSQLATAQQSTTDLRIQIAGHNGYFHPAVLERFHGRVNPNDVIPANYWGETDACAQIDGPFRAGYSITGPVVDRRRAQEQQGGQSQPRPQGQKKQGGQRQQQDSAATQAVPQQPAAQPQAPRRSIFDPK